MKNRPAAPLIVSAMTLLATSLGVAGATAQDGRSQDRRGDSTATASKGDRLDPQAAQSRQIKGENLDARQAQSRQLKIDGGVLARPQSRQLKIDGGVLARPHSRQLKADDTANEATRSQQIKKGPPGDGG